MDKDAKSLKVGLVLDSGLDKPDGVQQYVLDIGQWLSNHGHEVHYLVGKTRRQDIKNLHSLGSSIPVRFNGNDGSIPLFARPSTIKRLLAREQFDVLHVQTPHHPLLAQPIIMAAGQKTAIIGTFHVAPLNALSAIGNRLLGIWLKPSLSRFDQIVSVSPAAADFARKTFKITTDILPNVVDYQHFHSAKPYPKYDDDMLTILFLGRLVPRKGCHLLLEAIALLAGRQGIPKFRVLICGQGPLESKLRHFTSHHGLNDRVEFMGYVSEDDKPRYYASADIAVFPASGGESFGIVLLEAMATGRAVVLAGDNPGYGSVMAAQPELLFNPTDAGALADKLAEYMLDQPRREKLRDFGSAHAREFDVSVVAAKLLSIYYQALRKRRGA